MTQIPMSIMEGDTPTERSPHTHRCYGRAVAAFRAWCADRGCQYLPASPRDIENYLENLSGDGLRYSSIRVARAAIADVHRRSGHPDPTRYPDVASLMIDLRRGDDGCSSTAQPLDSSALGVIRDVACTPRAVAGARPRRENAAEARARGLLDIAIISVMSEAGLRRSEVSALRWRDIVVREDGLGVITMPRRSGSHGEFLVGTDCLEDLEAIRSPYAGPDDLVIGLSPSQIGRRIRAAAKEAGLGDGFTGQSCRIGRVYDLAENGASVQEIMHAGGWQSPMMPRRYMQIVKAGGDV